MIKIRSRKDDEVIDEIHSTHNREGFRFSEKKKVNAKICAKKKSLNLGFIDSDHYRTNIYR